MGGEKIPISVANINTVAIGQCHHSAAIKNPNATGSITPVMRRGSSGPIRSIMRPCTGAAMAMEKKYTPSTMPATLKFPNDSRRYITIESPIMPTGMRDKNVMIRVTPTSGRFRKSR